MRRVKRTSMGIWRRDWVMSKMFVGEKYGKVEMSDTTDIVNRMDNARDTEGEAGRIGWLWDGAARIDR